jgi:hypothetical protein
VRFFVRTSRNTGVSLGMFGAMVLAAVYAAGLLVVLAAVAVVCVLAIPLAIVVLAVEAISERRAR